MIVIALLAALTIAVPARAAAPPVPRVAIEAPAGPGSAATLAAALGAPPAFPVAVRLEGTLDADGGGLDAQVADYEAHGFELWLATAIPADPAGMPAWRQSLELWMTAHRDRLAVLELRLGNAPASVAQFAIEAAATDLRVTAPRARLAISGPRVQDAAGAATLVTADLAPYLDLIATSSADTARSVLQAIHGHAPAVGAVIVGMALSPEPDRAIDDLAQREVDIVSTPVVSIAVRDSVDVLAAVLKALRPMAPLLAGDADALDAASSSLRLSAGGADAASIPHRLLFENGAFGTYLFYRAPVSSEPMVVSVNVPVEGTPMIVDLERGTETAAAGYRRESGTVTLQAPQTGRPMLIDFNAGATQVFAQRSGVTAARSLSVEEIIARHRQQQAAQDAVLQHYAATVHMEQHFRPTMTDPGYDVVTDNRYFSAPGDVEWEELSFSVNGSKWGSNRPPFPMLQPEKVLSLPLQLRFGSDYRYRLAGTERVDGFDCYVVRFDPIETSRSLYRGTVWIDRATFARVRVQAVQTNLSAPVVSNDELQHYAPVATIGGRPIFLLDHLSAKQIVMIAGRNILVEKSVVFSEFVVNGAAFVEHRAGARASDHVMYRDTDHGLRYYVKRDDTRVVSDHPTEKAKAMAMGVTLDPSFAFPLPIFGINYLNFSFGSPDNQLAVLFGGVLAAINVQRPKIGRTPFDASVDFFGIAVPSSDRLYDAHGEREAERVLTWPITTGLNVGWQYTPFQKLTFQYQFRYDFYHLDTTTSAAYVVPSSTMTNGLGGAYEYRRGGYSFVANSAWYRRARWRPWGLPDPAQPGRGLETAEPSYAKYQASLSRDFYLGPFQKLHFNGAWFGGSHLDRFSRYEFGMFDDTRIHGVPASGVRFDDLAMARGTYSFDVFEQYRLDLFLEQAWGRDLTAGRDWQPVTGLGVAVNFRAPFNTILRADVGHALLPSRYGGIGSTVVQILLLKPLGS
ncbi:MAG TPA: hypothetical protein VFX12_03990 [Vicinamibacterales bacterium]|nr:hypothetical protein [Vicinamibacterales bacterium]